MTNAPLHDGRARAESCLWFERNAYLGARRGYEKGNPRDLRRLSASKLATPPATMAEGRGIAPGHRWRLRSASSRSYLTVTLAPAASSLVLMSAASCLEMFSFTFCGAPSTRSLASFRPRSGRTVRTSLITLIFLSPPPVSTTVNSVCSSAASAGAARRRAGGGGHGHRRGGGDAPLLFQQLGELGGFQNGQRGEVFDEFFEVGHGLGSFRARAMEWRVTFRRRPWRRRRAKTRASWPAGAWTTPAIRVAGRLDEADELGAQLVERGQLGQGVDALGVQHLARPSGRRRR